MARANTLNDHEVNDFRIGGNTQEVLCHLVKTSSGRIGFATSNWTIHELTQSPLDSTSASQDFIPPAYTITGAYPKFEPSTWNLSSNSSYTFTVDFWIPVTSLPVTAGTYTVTIALTAYISPSMGSSRCSTSITFSIPFPSTESYLDRDVWYHYTGTLSGTVGSIRDYRGQPVSISGNAGSRTQVSSTQDLPTSPNNPTQATYYKISKITTTSDYKVYTEYILSY